MFEIILTKSYRKKAVKFIKSHPDLKKKYKVTLLLLKENPFHPSLKLHQLQGDLSEFRSISLTYKFRILITLRIKNNQIILVDIGTHDELYR